MAFWQWQTLPDGRVEVDRQDGAGPSTAGPTDHPGVRATADRVAQWIDLATAYGKKHDVPVSWILSIIMAESGGDPKAENYCCAGLMAIFYSVHHKSKEDMLDPDKNVDYGTSLLAQSRSAGYDLPEAASIHVAGAASPYAPHPSQKSPWGMREYVWTAKVGGDGSVGYIDRVARFNNFWIERLSAKHAPEPRPPLKASIGRTLTAFSLGAIAGFSLSMLLPPVRRAHLIR